MVLKEVSDANSIQDTSSDYWIFYSSIDPTTDQLWCPDCLRVETMIKSVFDGLKQPSATIIYVGQKAEWKNKSNVFRGEPWNVKSVPTIIRVRDNTRLVDDEITSSSLEDFTIN